MMTQTETTLIGRSILVVEDEYFIAEDIACQLNKAGAEVVGPAANVNAAIRLIKQTERLDGAILDINLQGAMSWPVADALIQRGVRFVFATGYDSAVIPKRYAEITCCEKPVAPDKTAKALFG